MLIGKLAEATGVSKDTVRFYEKQGLVTSSSKRAGSRMYRDYDASMIEQIRRIKRGQAFGYTLAELKPIVQRWGSERIGDVTERYEVIRSKLDQLLEHRREIDEMIRALQDALNGLPPDFLADRTHLEGRE